VLTIGTDWDESSLPCSDPSNSGKYLQQAVGLAPRPSPASFSIILGVMGFQQGLEALI
jgi:hypothetical protein